MTDPTDVLGCTEPESSTRCLSKLQGGQAAWLQGGGVRMLCYVIVIFFIKKKLYTEYNTTHKRKSRSEHRKIQKIIQDKSKSKK